MVSGNLKLKAGQFLDYEKEPSVSVKITATDTHGASDSKTVKINVQDDVTDTLVNKNIGLTLVNNTGNTNDNITQDGTFKITKTNGHDWLYKIDSGTWQKGTSDTIKVTGNDGQHRIEVAFADKTGKAPVANTPQGYTVVLDTQTAKPTASTTYDKLTQKMTVTGTAEAGATLNITVGSKTVNATAGSDGQYSATVDVARTNTTHREDITVKATDKAGNSNSFSGQTAEVPATLNNKSIGLKLANDTGSSNSDGITKNSTFNVSNTNGKDWIWRLDGGNWSSKRTGDGQITGITGDKQHRVEVAFTEDGKNPVSGTPQGFNFTLDTTVAKPTNVQSEYNNGVFKVTGQAEANATLKLTVDATSKTVSVGSDGKFSVDFNIAQGNTDHRPTIKATVTDKAGNVNSDYTDTGANIPKLPVSDDKVAKARKAIADLQAAVTKAEQDGTVEHNEYDNLNALRDAAKAAVQAVGTGDSAYQGLKNDLNSAANYVRGTTFEHAKDVMGTYNKTVTGTSSYSASNAQTIIDVVNVARSMNNLTEITRINDSAVNNWTQAGANANILEHNTNNSTGSSIVYKSTGTTHNPGAGWVDDSSVDSLGHRMQALNPRLVHSDAAVGNGSNHIGVMLTLEYYNQTLLGGKLYDKGNNHNAPKTIEWPAEGYIPYAMMPNQGIGTGTSWDGGQTWHFSSYASIWTFSAKDQSLNGATVSVNKNGSNIANFSSSQVSAVTSNGSIGWSDPSWYDGDYYYSTIKWDMNGKFSDPGSGVDDYAVTIKANGGYEYTYHIYVFNDANAAQNHANQPVTLLSHEIQRSENILSGSLNEPETVITGSEQSDVAQVAELSANAAVNMNAGDDVIEIAHYLGGEINGGDGFDAVVLTGGTNALSGNHLHDVEMIDLGNAETPNVLSLTASDLLENHDVDGCLWILGQAGNRVALLDGITASDNTVEKDGELFHQYTYTTTGSTYAVMIGDDLYQNNGVVI